LLFNYWFTWHHLTHEAYVFQKFLDKKHILFNVKRSRYQSVALLMSCVTRNKTLYITWFSIRIFIINFVFSHLLINYTHWKFTGRDWKYNISSWCSDVAQHYRGYIQGFSPSLNLTIFFHDLVETQKTSRFFSVDSLSLLVSLAKTPFLSLNISFS